MENGYYSLTTGIKSNSKYSKSYNKLLQLYYIKVILLVYWLETINVNIIDFC